MANKDHSEIIDDALICLVKRSKPWPAIFWPQNYDSIVLWLPQYNKTMPASGDHLVHIRPVAGISLLFWPLPYLVRC